MKNCNDWVCTPYTAEILNICMCVFIDREGSKCPKRPYWGENRIKRRMYEETYGSNSYLNLHCSVTDATENGKRFRLLTTLNAKLVRLLRVLPVWWNSLIGELLSPGLLENVNNWVASRSILLLSILWVRTRSFHIKRAHWPLNIYHLIAQSLCALQWLKHKFQTGAIWAPSIFSSLTQFSLPGIKVVILTTVIWRLC